jgi:hypothetical protein
VPVVSVCRAIIGLIEERDMMTFEMDATVARRLAVGSPRARAGVERITQVYEQGVQDLIARCRNLPLIDVEPEVEQVLAQVGACGDPASVRRAALAIQHGRAFDVRVRLV